MRSMALSWLVAMALVASGCAAEDEALGSDNPFLVDQTNLSKEDTQYANPDGIEVEVDLEADVTGSSYQVDEGPAALGQFALTFLRKRGDFYLESLAETATSSDRVEWRVDGNWVAAGDAGSLTAAQKTHFRIRGVNAVLLHSASNGAKVGKQFLAKVPRNPFTIFSDVGDKCADKDDGHITLDQSVYWYMWDPSKSTCKAEIQQEMLITISRMLPKGEVTYPEYDQLVADGRVTAVVLFGQIGDGALKDNDIGMVGFRDMAENLLDADYKEVTPAPVGRRFTRTFGGVAMEIDLYSPKEFSGLGDYGNFGNFEKAISEHEIVVYDGHSMLGGSDFFAKPEYPKFYQIFLYGGCLGYEYYVNHIYNGKGGWDKVDIMSSVIEVSVGSNEFAAPVLAKIAWALEHKYNASWRDILIAVRKSVGDSTFGVSGVRDNCFSPAGSLCGGETPAGEAKRFESKKQAAIPDADDAGVSSTLSVSESGTVGSLRVEFNVTHSYVGDLRMVLSHNGVEAVVWDNAGGAGADINETLTLSQFNGKEMSGDWTLTVVDSYAADAGFLNSWAIEISPK